MIGPRHQDDRGKPVRLLALGSHAPDGGGWKHFTGEVWRRFRQGNGAIAIGAGVALVGILIAAWLMKRDVLPLMFFSPVGSTLVLLVAVTALGVGHAWRQWPLWVRETHLRHSVCPACGYGLLGQMAQPDGCVVCPECASAWNVADEQATHADRSIVVVQEDRSTVVQSSEKSSPPIRTLEIRGEANS